MLELLQEAKNEAWQTVLATHAALVETRTAEAADAHRDALCEWWRLADLFDREVASRLAVFHGVTSGTGAP